MNDLAWVTRMGRNDNNYEKSQRREQAFHASSLRSALEIFSAVESFCRAVNPR
jgi:hypothetical protein